MKNFKSFFTIAFCFSLINNVSAKETTKFIIKQKNNKSVITNVVKKEHDFRKTYWGMSPKDVQLTEKSPPVKVDKDKNQIIYNENLMGVNSQVIYEFKDNKLIKGKYEFIWEGKQSNADAYKKIIGTLTEKYGNPSDENFPEIKNVSEDNLIEYINDIANNGDELLVKWNTSYTNITSRIGGKSLFSPAKLEIIYDSNKMDEKYIKKDKKEEEKFKF